ncbi:hypothetical protein [Niallia sp. FSL M8-0099]|uniref:hypothetical protein n=1 Tax=Niallia sp. FSL M8-0099 TaxID=2954519 RepID=UPI0030FBBBD4
MNDYPNVMIIPPNDITPEQLINRYVDMIHYSIERNEPIEEILFDLFDDANRWTSKQFLIDLAAQSLQELENIKEHEDDFDEEDIDE